MQVAVDAHRPGDQNSNSSNVVKNMNLLANSSYRHQIMNGRRHSVKMYMNDENTHAAINNKKFRSLGHINDELFEVELSKSGTERT